MKCFILEKYAKDKTIANNKRNSSANEFAAKISCLNVLYNPAGSYMFKVNNKNTKTNCKRCSNLTIKIPE